MEFLYRELPSERRGELGAHLEQCDACAKQVKSWRASMTALDEWELPAIRRAPVRRWQPVLKWAAAAAVVLCVGFFLGRQTTNAASELATLKKSVAQLAATVERDREFNALNAADEAASTAATEVARLMVDYARVGEAVRAKDRRETAVALQEVESRLARLRAELETVAVNTQDSFQQTQKGLANLASLAISDDAKPARNP
jgi:hypothetical protein